MNFSSSDDAYLSVSQQIHERYETSPYSTEEILKKSNVLQNLQDIPNWYKMCDESNNDALNVTSFIKQKKRPLNWVSKDLPFITDKLYKKLSYLSTPKSSTEVGALHNVPFTPDLDFGLKDCLSVSKRPPPRKVFSSLSLLNSSMSQLDLDKYFLNVAMRWPSSEVHITFSEDVALQVLQHFNHHVPSALSFFSNSFSFPISKHSWLSVARLPYSNKWSPKTLRGDFPPFASPQLETPAGLETCILLTGDRARLPAELPVPLTSLIDCKDAVRGGKRRREVLIVPEQLNDHLFLKKRAKFFDKDVKLAQKLKTNSMMKSDPTMMDGGINDKSNIYVYFTERFEKIKKDDSENKAAINRLSRNFKLKSMT